MPSTETIQTGSFDLCRPARSRLLCTTRAVVGVNWPTPINRQRGGGSDCRTNDVRNHACTDVPRGQLVVRAAQ